MTDQTTIDRVCLGIASIQEGNEVRRQIDALAARLADAEREIAELNRQLSDEMEVAALLRDKLAEAERLLREWRTVADIAKDMCFVPVAKATDKFLGTADSADACPKCGAADHSECPCSPDEQWEAAASAAETEKSPR